MKKKYNELTQEEETEFINELGKMFTFGSACLVTAAKNVGAESSGWPHISVGLDTEVSMCEALDLLRKSSRSAMIRDLTERPFGFLLMGSAEQLEELAVHEALHDAFCLGMAAVSLMEMNFDGVDELLSQIQQDDNDRKY